MDMQQVQQLIIAEAGSRIGELATSAPIAGKADALRDASRFFQALAICKLLVQADVPVCKQHLLRSGYARRYYLRKSAEQGNTNDRFLALSRVEAIMDVLVAGDMQLAREIVGLSIRQWHSNWEYEDDYCYFAFIHGLIRDSGFIDSDEAVALLAQFHRALEGQPSVRLRLCRALRARDAADFRSAFERFITEYAAATDEKRASFTEYTSDAPQWPRLFVSIEALAWLDIAGWYGLSMPDQYRFCPQEARGLTTASSVDDVFGTLDQALASP
jgi:Immunity protein 49